RAPRPGQEPTQKREPYTHDNKSPQPPAIANSSQLAHLPLLVLDCLRARPLRAGMASRVFLLDCSELLTNFSPKVKRWSATPLHNNSRQRFALLRATFPHYQYPTTQKTSCESH